MPQINDLNVRPYYDDYNPVGKYYRILFRPGIAVQARELTQLQSSLQNQIEVFGKHIFKNGSKIINAEQFFEGNLVSIKIENQFNSIDVNLQNFVGKRITGQTSGCIGIVKELVEYIDLDNPKKIIIQILSGSEFVAEEEVWTNDTVPYKATIKADGVLNAITEALRYSITAGVFFINGLFVFTEAQSLILDSEGNTSSHSIGFDIVETFVGADSDASLTDPANGTNNYAAPGADRLAIELTLTKTTLANTRTNYIEIARVENGILTYEVSRAVYAEIEKELARRTFDESGNYVVSHFNLSLEDHFTAAKATVNLSGGIVQTVIPNATGIKFDAVPTISIIGDGSGALATIVLDNDPVSATYKEIVSITVDSAGSGYTSAQANISGDSTKFMCKLDAGKAYVKGFEFETISPSYIETTKPREVDQADNLDVSVNYANFIYVTALNRILDPNLLQTIDLHKDVRASAAATNKIGTARVRMLKFVSGTVGSGTETYKVSLFDIQMTKKSIISASWLAGKTTFTLAAGHGFTAGQQVVIRGDNNYFGTHTVLASPAPNATTFAVSMESDLGAVSSTATVENLFKDLESIVTSSTNGANVSLLSKTGGDANGDVFLTGSDADSLVFPLNNTWVKTIRDAQNSPQSDYTYQSTFSAVSFTAGEATISTNGGLERFFGSAGALTDTIKDAYYFAIVTDVGTSLFSIGDIIRFDNASTRSITLSTPSVGIAQQATFDANVATNFTANIIATINANTQTEKVKSLQDYSYIIISSPNATVGNSDSLGIADIKELKAVFNTSTTNPTGQITFNSTTGEITSWGTVPAHTNVTNAYKLDNGQRDSIYDHGAIVLQNGSTTEVTDYIVVVFNHYTHTGSGFLSVDSYSENYADIPVYTSPLTGVEFNLRDCIDFRPRRADNTTTFNSVKFPDSDFTFNTDYQYYLPRVDRIFALSEKSFSLVRGVPNLNPLPPPIGGNDSLLLYTLVIPPYLVAKSDISVYYHAQQRFTMSDIGKIEDRVRRLEYYASLSLLEQQAKETQILDSNNLDKFKNGFFVDPFVGHYIGDIGNYNYRCAIDPEEQELRASVSTEQLDFDISDNISTVNDISRLTLDYTEEIFLEQLFASDSISVNPYNIITYVGDLSINPPSDSWEEVQILPEVVNTINVTNNQTRVVEAIRNSAVTNVTNVIRSVPVPSDAQKQFLAQGQRSGLGTAVYNPKTQTISMVQGNTGSRITNVNSQVMNNILGRK